MTFDSISSIESYIKTQMKHAIIKAENEVYQIVSRFVKQYYSEFSPELYERTYQLYRSLVKSEIISTGNGYEAYVYFDLDKLDYHIKRLNGVEYPNKNWSEAKTLAAAAHGSHGGKVSGTAIWDESLVVLNAETNKILKRMLQESGIPVK